MNPEQQKIFLGIVFDLVRYQARPSQDHIQRCLGVMQMFLRKPLQPALYWQRIIGHLVSLTKIVPLGATMLRPIQRPEFPMEPGVSDSILQGCGIRRGLIISSVVVGGTEPPTGDVPLAISTPSANVYRCFISGVGCLSELTVCSGHLGCERIQAHQYTRNDRSSAGLPVLHRSHPGLRPPGIVGQHHCGGVHQPPGRYSVQPHIPCCRVFSLFPIQPQGESEVSSHSRDPKHSSRPTVEGDIPVLDRMVSSPRGSIDGLRQIPSSPGGPVRNPSQQQTRCVCIPLPAPSGRGGRCSEHIVG